MASLSPASQISLYVLLGLIGLMALTLWAVQIWVLRGNAFPNPDSSKDDWHEQKIIYGIAFADAVLAGPAAIAGVLLVFLSPRWGLFLLALVSFWLVWANIMTTATSLRFHQPRMTLAWFVAFPFGGLVGLTYVIWVIVHFDIIFGSHGACVAGDTFLGRPWP
jgi:hypothetical protein